MKLIPLLLCLLLCGCARELPAEKTAPPASTVLPEETTPVSMYAPDHPLTTEQLKVYPLTQRKAQSILPTQDGLLVFSGYGSTTITRLTGENLTITAETTLDFELSSGAPSLRMAAGFLSFCDPVRNEMVVLNPDLREISRIALPKELVGSPLLSEDRRVIYYCTTDAILAWDLSTGVHRTVKALSYPQQQLTGLHLEDTVLQCRILDGDAVHTLFLSTETGQILSQQKDAPYLTTSGQQYAVILPLGSMELLIFGSAEENPKMLCPADLTAQITVLPDCSTAITTAATDDSVTLTGYDLTSGTQLDTLVLPPRQQPKSIISGPDGSVYLLTYDPERDCDTVYRWIFSESSESTSVHTGPYAANASSAMEECHRKAADLSEKYGMEIRIGEAAVAISPWDYQLQAEALPMVLMHELTLLDQRLSLFPEEVLRATCSHFSSVKLCLVRQITGTAESGSLDTATGIQFYDGTDAYVVITVGRYSQQALYHELFHVMETHILNESTALDQWNQLNPVDFEYHYGSDFTADYSAYLSGSSRAFIDSYSMSFPKEDRARIWENALLGGNSALFQATVLQNKLTKLCIGVREAYGLRKSPEIFPWEQYLLTPLAYTK